MDTNLDMNQYRAGNSPEDAAKLAAVRLAVTNPEQIPAQRYYDQAFFQLEQEKLWPHVWQMAARLEEIPNIGDYVEYRNLDKSVIVVRTASGVKAFNNACRHRGVQLVSEPGNCKGKGFICPFHGWRWNMDGANTFVFGQQIFNQELLEKAETNLVAVRCELWGGHAFINHDNDAPSLMESLGPITERLGIRNVEHLRMEWWYATVLPTNWKLAMEAFMEGYHTMRTHPQLHALSVASPFGYDSDTPTMTKQMNSRENVDLFVTFMERLGSGMAGMVHDTEIDVAKDLAGSMELAEEPMTALGAFIAKLKEEIHARGVANGFAVPDIMAVDAADPHRTVEFIFPHYFLLPMFGAMSSYRIRPLTAETCYFELFSLAFVEEKDEKVRPKVLAYNSQEFPEIPRQDYSNLPLQQLGLHAGGFEYMRLSNKFEGTISNYQRLIDGYIAGLDPAKLAKAQNIVNDGFDHPIANIGF